MDLNSIKETIETKVYHLTDQTNVPLHKHDDKDEIFYCIKGSGFGVLADGEEELTRGKAFIVPRKYTVPFIRPILHLFYCQFHTCTLF